ncbi:MAG: glycosyltransferase family 9 protein [Prevotella sp.]|nr:glycosyltransferase family 9 protein [Prevotella sp.]
MKKEHILVIRFSAMGDVAMVVPVVWSLAHQYPDVRITVLSRAFARPLFDDLAPNVGFMEADVKKEYHGIKGLNALYRRLIAKQFTAIADLHNVLRSGFLRMRFNMDHYRVAHIDKHRKGRRRITSATNKQLTQQPTSFQNYAAVFAQLGYPVDITFKSIFEHTPTGKGDLSLLPETLHSQFSILNSPFSILNSQFIGIAPFAAHQGKIYPPRLMQQVIEMLIHKHPQAQIFFFGRGEEEERYFTEWCRLYPQCTYTGRYLSSLHEELILMSHLDVMVSMDSANMHLASLTATPVVSIWGATHPYTGFMGWNQDAQNAVQTDLDCRPCSVFGQKPCLRGDYACMNRIAPETIVEKVEHILQAK